MHDDSLHLTRRSVVRALAGAGVATPALLRSPASATYPAILKPTPATTFFDYGTNAEMRWDAVSPVDHLMDPSRLFVRNHTRTPVIGLGYTLQVFGDGLVRDRGRRVTLAELRHRLPVVRRTTVHECTGNGRSYFGSQQGQTVSGTPWKLGSVGAVTWEGVRLADLLEHVGGIRGDAVDVMATGLDPNYVDKGTDYGRVRRPFPIAKAYDDALLAWGMNGRDLLPDHGAPLRLVLPGWVGIGSIKWLGSLRVSTTAQTSPWNTKWYRMTGGSYPVGSPPLTVNPVRSAWELAEGATLPAGGAVLTGRSWSGAGRIARVDVSEDGGTRWTSAELVEPGTAWTRWRHRWSGGVPGAHVLMARATDVAGRTQPLTTPYNDGGYFFDAVVRFPVRVA